MKIKNINSDSVLKLKRGTVKFNDGTAFIGITSISIDYSDIEFNEIPSVFLNIVNPSYYAANDLKVYAANITKTGCDIIGNQVNSSFGGVASVNYLIIGE